MWSKVFASDMFATNFEKDPMDPVQGLKYREEILQKGGSMDAMQMLTDYLGRKPKPDAFYKEIGL